MKLVDLLVILAVALLALAFLALCSHLAPADYLW